MRKIDLKTLKVWKLILLIVGLMMAFLILAGIAEGIAMEVESISIIVSIVGGLLIVVAYYEVLRRMNDGNTDSVSIKSLPKNILYGFAVGFLFFVATAAVLYITGCYSISKVAYSSDLFKSLAFFFLVACAEEVLCRGMLFRMIDERWGYVAAMTVSALLFGFGHLPNDNATIWSCIAIAIEAGLLLGAAYKFSGSLWFPIGIHWAWNFTEGPLLGFSVSGEGGYSSLITPTLNGPTWLTGGSFGPEASVITVLLGIILVIWFTRRICPRSLK